MSRLIDLDLSPEPKTLRQFGWIAVFGFGILALLAWFETAIFAYGLGTARLTVVSVLGGLSVISGVFSLVYPKANLPIYLGLTVIAFPIGFVLSYLIMGTLFYLMITPVGLIFKLTGRDPLNRKFDPDAESYWDVARADRPKDSYFKQF